jgi:hypothetical protein
VRVSRWGLVLVLFVALTPVAAASTIEAHPDGAADCNPKCNFSGAVASATAADEVVVMPGTHVLDQPVNVTTGIVIRAGAGARPILQPSASAGLSLSSSTPDDRAVIRDVAVHGEAMTVGTNAVAERVETEGGVAGVRLTGNAVLRDSAIFAYAANARAVAVNGVLASGGEPVMLNTVAITYAAGSIGAGAAAFSGSEPCFPVDAQLRVVNSVVRGVAADLAATGSGPCASAAVTVSYSNYQTAMGTVIDEGHNQTSAAETNLDVLFYDQFGFQELPTSPTRDAGTLHPDLGATDFEGAPRVSDGAPDIGFDEYPQGPAVTTLDPTEVTATSATLRAQVTAGMRDAKVVFDHGPTMSYGSTTSEQAVPARTGPVIVTAPVTGLTAGELRHFRGRAFDGASFQPTGSAGQDFAFTPVQPPAPTPTPTPTPTATPSPGPTATPGPLLSRLSASRTVRRRALRRGLRISFVLGERATYRIALTAKVRRRVRRLLVFQTITPKAAGVVRQRLKASRRALRKLPRRVRATLAVTAVTSSGEQQTLRTPVLIRR